MSIRECINFSIICKYKILLELILLPYDLRTARSINSNPKKKKLDMLYVNNVSSHRTLLLLIFIIYKKPRKVVSVIGDSKKISYKSRSTHVIQKHTTNFPHSYANFTLNFMNTKNIA